MAYWFSFCNIYSNAVYNGVKFTGTKNHTMVLLCTQNFKKYHFISSSYTSLWTFSTLNKVILTMYTTVILRTHLPVAEYLASTHELASVSSTYRLLLHLPHPSPPAKPNPASFWSCDLVSPFFSLNQWKVVYFRNTHLLVSKICLFEAFFQCSELKPLIFDSPHCSCHGLWISSLHCILLFLSFRMWWYVTK